MSGAYYNEIDPFCAEWLRRLIASGLIAPGEVDERSIEDVRPEDLRGFTQCHFFAGIGVWSHALIAAGWPDDRAVWTGSCPCQPFSSAGARKGFADERHLWPTWFYLIRERRPAVIFGEQVTEASEWLDLVQTDLEAERYSVGALDLDSALVGFPQRERFYWVADTYSKSERNCAINAEVAGVRATPRVAIRAWHELRRVGAGRDESAAGMGELRAYGNAIVAALAQAFVEAYMECRP